MKEMITGYLIDVMNGTAGPVTIEKSIDAYYEVLDCSCIDIKSRFVDIICDDEGIMKADARISAIDSKGDPMLVGNLFVVKFDGVEDETSLTEDDIEYVKRNIDRFATMLHPEPYPMLTWVEYE